MRSLSREARHERRVQVIRLRKVGNTYDEIAALTGLSRTGVFNICKRHEALGNKALHDTIGGRKVQYIILDDASDTTSAVKNTRKLISEDKVDAILGPNLISTAVAMADVANGEKVPMISVAPLDVSGDKRGFVFTVSPPPT